MNSKDNFKGKDCDTELTITIFIRDLGKFLQMPNIRKLARVIQRMDERLCRWFRFAQLAKGKKSRP
jgi:hypothetical protein